MHATVAHLPEEVNNRLNELGLSCALLHEALKMGHLARSTCTANDAPFFPALIQWDRTQRGLREQLIPLGWVKSDDNNYCTVVSPDKTLAIATASGCENTANPSLTPTTKSPKGPSTVDAVLANSNQSVFPFIPAPVVVANDGVITWILLYHYAGGEIRAELSLPASTGRDGRPNTWKERIILPSMSIEPNLSDVEPDFGPDFNVDVIRRG